MENDELELIADRAICNGTDKDGKYCGKPNLIWQSWRNLFRCGMCGKDHLVVDAQKLKRLTEKQYKSVLANRQQIISGASRMRQKME